MITQKIKTFFQQETERSKLRNLLKGLDFHNVSFSQILADVLKSMLVVPSLHSGRLGYMKSQSLSYWMFSNSSPQERHTVTLILGEKVSHSQTPTPVF